MHLKHIFFDFDGVLLDSLSAHKKAFIEAFKNNNIDYTEFVYIAGKSSNSLIRNFLQKKGIENNFLIRKIVSEKQIASRSILELSLPVFEDQIEVLNKLHGMFNLSIVSSSSYYLIDKFITKYRIENIFEDVVSIENIEESKPSPAPYLKALMNNKVISRNAVAIEDSKMGLESAKGAGIETIRFDPPIGGDPNVFLWHGISCKSYVDLYDRIVHLSEKS